MTTTTAPSPRSDPELLGAAEELLERSGFRVERVDEPLSLILAEDPHFVVAVAALHTIHDLVALEGIAEEALTKRLAESQMGPKKWDAYLVLLTQERSVDDESLTRALYGINYDTARLRRIAHTGVDPTTAAIGQALAPFVAPAGVSTTAPVEDPFASLAKALVARGVDRDLADRAIAAFEQGAELDDVL